MNDLKNLGDAAAGVTGFAAWLQWLPEIAAGLTILWYAGRITGVVKRWLRER
jgi:hypothetical protein